MYIVAYNVYSTSMYYYYVLYEIWVKIAIAIYVCRLLLVWRLLINYIHRSRYSRECQDTGGVFFCICAFLVGYEKIRHKRTISFWLHCHSYLFGVRRFWTTSWYRTYLCLVIERTNFVLSFFSKCNFKFNICKYCLIYSRLASHILFDSRTFVALRIISKF